MVDAQELASVTAECALSASLIFGDKYLESC